MCPRKTGRKAPVDVNLHMNINCPCRSGVWGLSVLRVQLVGKAVVGSVSLKSLLAFHPQSRDFLWNGCRQLSVSLLIVRKRVSLHAARSS